MPVIWPGYSFYNALVNTDGRDPAAALKNPIPRMGGRFLWTQSYEYSRLGIQSMYTAMFDEVNEGTAIFKLAPTSATTPNGCYALTLDADGLQLPADWYLQVSGAISGSLKTNTLPSTPDLPIHPSFQKKKQIPNE